MVEIDGPDHAQLDTRAIVLACPESQVGRAPAAVAEPTIVWQGTVAGDGSGPSSNYWVRLYAGGGGHCSCPDYYFRGLLRRQLTFRCKHLVRTWASHGPSDLPERPDPERGA